MQKNSLSQPVLVYMYGLPGSGKTFVSRQLSELLGMAHLNSEQIRLELFEKPRYDASEQRIVKHLMTFMAEQFLNAGVSVIYDMSVNRLSERKVLRDFAQKHGAKDLLVWLQVDLDSAWARCEARDRRTNDDKYSEDFDKRTFESFIQNMQNPSEEKALVLSGKHLFNSQKNALLRRLYDLGALKEESLDQKIAKPELVNLVSRAQADAGRSDYLRRNVIIR
jgi:predicted kinase